MNDYRDIITIESGKRSGQPCIRECESPFTTSLNTLHRVMTVAEVLHDFPELTEADIRACFAYRCGQGKITGGCLHR